MNVMPNDRDLLHEVEKRISSLEDENRRLREALEQVEEEGTAMTAYTRERMKYAIRNRWTGSIIAEAEIECSADASEGVKRGLAAKAAYKSGADLRGVDLREADLSEADLREANLSGRIPLHADTARRYVLYVLPEVREGPRFIAGCRNFTAAEALAHWGPESRHSQPEYVAAIQQWLADNNHALTDVVEASE